jgi:hypothetical protein
LSFTTLEVDQRSRPPSDASGPVGDVGGQPARPRGRAAWALPGPMRAPDSKMMLSLIFSPSRHFASRIVLELPKLSFCKGADLTGGDIWPPLPTHRTLLQTADMVRPAEYAATSFIERQKRGERGRLIAAAVRCLSRRGRSLWGNGNLHRAEKRRSETYLILRGTEGSNPPPSSSESSANLTFLPQAAGCIDYRVGGTATCQARLATFRVTEKRRTIPRKPTWLAELSMGCAWRAAGR